MIRLTKQQQKQYSKLANKFKISKREYLDLYSESRKARAKANRLNKEGQVLKIPKMSTSFNWIKTREDFLKTRRNVRTVLKRDFKKKINHEQRQQFYNNILKYFGNSTGGDLIQEFSQLSDGELLEFFEDNDDLDKILYDSSTEVLDLINMTKEKMLSRLESFANYE